MAVGIVVMAAALQPHQRAAFMQRLELLESAMIANSAVGGLELKWCLAKTACGLRFLRVRFSFAGSASWSTSFHILHRVDTFESKDSREQQSVS